MNRKEKIQFAGILFLAVLMYLFMARICFMQRGYWAVGGEMFIPIMIAAWGIHAIFKEEKQ